MSTMFAAKYPELFSFHDTMSIMGCPFWRWAEADRFGILNDRSPYNFVVDPNKFLPMFKMIKQQNMRDILLNRASHILNFARKTDKKLAVLWSGGVDSTTVISSLILVGATPDDMIILCTQDSINEYQRGYTLLKNKFKFKFSIYEWTDSLTMYKKFGTDVYFVTGWCADQLFGSNLNLVYPDCYRMFWKDGLKHILTDTIRNKLCVDTTDEEINDTIDDFEMYSKKLDLPLKYTCDALWLFNFGIKWSHVCRDFALTLDNEDQRKNIINFFEPTDFQEWSILNYTDFYKRNQATEPKYYKRPFKELIYEVFKDKYYLDNKGKVNSWISVIRFIQYSNLYIWDAEKGIVGHDLWEEKFTTSVYPSEVQRLNRRKCLIPYLKDWVDKEKYIKEKYW